MDCITTKNLISDYSVGLIEGKQKAEMDEHLASCSECKAELVKLDSVMALVEGLSLREPPAGLWNGVYNRITADTPEHSGFRQRLGRVFHRTTARLTLGIATAALAVALTFTFVHAPVKDVGSVRTSAMVQSHVSYSDDDILLDQVALNGAAAMSDRDQTESESL
ncbi:MAG TPA: hypothetical protein VGK34_01745 [Armatimonadota bacterium]